MHPPISVIIPTLNEENYLPLLLGDLSHQTDKHFEVIVIDANSDDKTREKAQEFKNEFPFTFMVSPKRRVAYQRNLAAKKAKGEYLFFIDADTRIEKDVIERILKHIKKEHELLYLPIVKASNPSFVNRLLVSASVASVMALQKIGKALSVGPMIVIEKNFFEKIGGFNETIQMAEDHNLVIKAHQAGIKAKFLTDVQCFFSMRRFDSEGTWSIVGQYLRYTAVTLMKGGVNKIQEPYEMGGQRYEKNPTN